MEQKEKGCHRENPYCIKYIQGELKLMLETVLSKTIQRTLHDKEVYVFISLPKTSMNYKDLFDFF